MNIRVHIERLILSGLPFSKSQGARFQSALELELARLLTAGGASRDLLAGGAFARVDTPAISMRAGQSPNSLGRQIARAVFAGIGGEHAHRSPENELNSSRR